MVAGATDVGLWVTKGFRELGPVAFLNRIPDLSGVTVTDDEIRIGAATTTDRAARGDCPRTHPAFAELIRRYGSVQVRNAATIGGNVANGSPIGDRSPALIALGCNPAPAISANGVRALPIEDFFIDYGKQDRRRERVCRGDHDPEAANRRPALLQTVETVRSGHLGRLRMFLDRSHG